MPRNPRPIDLPTVKAATRVTRILMELPTVDARRAVISFALSTCVPEYSEPKGSPLPSVSPLRLHDAGTVRSSGE